MRREERERERKREKERERERERERETSHIVHPSRVSFSLPTVA